MGGGDTDPTQPPADAKVGDTWKYTDVDGDVFNYEYYESNDGTNFWSATTGESVVSPRENNGQNYSFEFANGTGINIYSNVKGFDIGEFLYTNRSIYSEILSEGTVATQHSAFMSWRNSSSRRIAPYVLGGAVGLPVMIMGGVAAAPYLASAATTTYTYGSTAGSYLGTQTINAAAYTYFHGGRLVSTSIGYLGSAYVYSGRQLFGEQFLRYHPRIFGQNDAAHRAGVFLRDDLMKASPAVVDRRKLSWSFQNGSKYYSIGVNPWTRSIYHMGPSANPKP